MKKVFIACDGGSRGNPGPSASAFVVYSGSNISPAFQSAFYWGRMTNNQAEYLGLLTALRWFNREITKTTEKTELVIQLDSELVVRQVNGEYKIKSENLKKLHFLVKEEIKRMPVTTKFSLIHKTRENNFSADHLLNQLLDIVSLVKE